MAKHIERAVKAALFIAVVLYAPYKLFEWIGQDLFRTMVFTTFASTFIQSVMSKGVDSSSGNFGTKFANRSAVAARQIVYGECRVGGTIVNIKTSGTDNHKLHMIIALAGHKLNSLQSVQIGSDTLSSSASGQFQRVTTAKYVNTDNDNALTGGSLIRFRFVDGSQTSADSHVIGAFPGMLNTDIGIDVAYVYVECIYDQEKFGSFPNFSFIVRGKEVFDPRDSSTAFSSNPALCIRDYLSDTTYGLKATDDELNDTTNAGGFSSAANTCDQSVTINNLGTTETRYTLNGFSDMSAQPEDLIRNMLTSCGGKLSYIDGKFQLFVAAAQTPSLTITDDNVLSPPSFNTKSITGQMANGIKSVFPDKNNDYIAGDAPIEEDSTFLAEDTPTGEQSANFKRILELQLPFTVTQTMAQRLQRIFLREQRQNVSVQLNNNIELMKLQPGDWLYLTNSRLGFTNKVMEVQDVALSPNESDETVFLTTKMTLREASASVTSFTFNEYSDPISDGDPGDSDDRSISAPTSLSGTVQSIIDGPTNKINIIAAWTNATNDNISGTDVQYKLSTDSEYSSIGVMKGVTNLTIANVSDNRTYNLRVRHFTPDGIFSDFSSVVNVAVNVAGNPGDPTNLTATTGRRVAIFVSWTNPSDTNLRSIKVYRKTANTTPTDDTDLVETITGEPGKVMQVRQGYPENLSPGTNYFFWVRAVNHLGNHSNFVGSATGNFGEFTGGDVGLNNLADLDSSQNTKLTNIEDNATLGAKLGVNLKDSGDNSLGDEDVRNSDLSIDFTGNTTFRIKKGSDVIDTQAFSKGNVGLSDLASLDSSQDSKLTGIEANATVGAKAGVNLKRNNNSVLGDADIITSEGTSDDTENVNSVAKADVTNSIVAAQTNVANVIQNLAAGSQNINAGALNAGTINTSLLKLDELFLPTEGVAAAGQSVNFGSSMTSVSLGSIGTGPGFYMGTASVEIDDVQGDDIRGASLHIDIKENTTIVYTKYWPIGIKEGNQYYDAGDQFGDNNDLPVMHLEFAFFYTGTNTLNLFVNGDSNDSITTCLIKARAVKFGAETVSFNPSSISTASGVTASSTVTFSAVTVSGFTGTKTVNLSGDSSALISVNSGSFVNSNIPAISANQTFQVRLTASPTAGSTRSATVEIGGQAITLSCTTAGTYTPTYSGGGGSGSAGGGFQTAQELV